jgi:hypothetical protein
MNNIGKKALPSRQDDWLWLLARKKEDDGGRRRAENGEVSKCFGDGTTLHCGQLITARSSLAASPMSKSLYTALLLVYTAI